MAGSDDDDGDKPFEATQKRLDDARKKGEIPRSTDLISAGALGGFLLAGAVLGAHLLGTMGTALSRLLGDADRLSTLWFDGPAAAVTAPVFVAVGLPMAGWLLPPAALAILAILGQRAFVISGEKLMPKLDRISPMKAAANKFGRTGLFEFAKSTVKLIIVSLILGLLISRRLPDILATMALDPAQATTLLLRLALDFVAIVFAVMLAIGGADLLWQRAEHARKNRMSHKDMMDEMKESEGDPHLKGKRRQRGIEIAMNQMLADVPTADVVIVNPTHFAVALKWERSKGGAPTCVAKGVDEVALKIRERAMEAGVPIRHDPPTARALYRVVEIGQDIPGEQYRAVAVAIRFADKMRARARAARGGRDAR